MGQPYSIFDKNLPARVALGGAGYYVGGRLIGAAPSPVETAAVAVVPVPLLYVANVVSPPLGMPGEADRNLYVLPAGAAATSFAFARSPAQAALAAATTFGAYKALDAK